MKLLQPNRILSIPLSLTPQSGAARIQCSRLPGFTRLASNGPKNRKRLEPKHVEPKHVEPKQVEHKQVEHKRAEPDNAELKSGVPKRVANYAEALKHVKTTGPKDMIERVIRCEDIIDYRFIDKKMCVEALSLSNDIWVVHPSDPSYYRILPPNTALAIVGDVMMAAWLGRQWYSQWRHSYVPPAYSSWQNLHNKIVTNANLKKTLDRLKLLECVSSSATAVNDKNGGTIMEALMGAIYMDGGDKAFNKFMDHIGLAALARDNMVKEAAMQNTAKYQTNDGSGKTLEDTDDTETEIPGNDFTVPGTNKQQTSESIAISRDAPAVDDSSIGDDTPEKPDLGIRQSPGPARPAEEPSEEPSEELAEESAEESAEQPAEESAEEPVEEPVEELAEEPAEESAEHPAEEPTEDPAEQPAEGPAQEPAEPESFSVKARKWIGLRV